MNLSLQAVLEVEKSILKNLYSLYLHDLSNFTSQLDIGEGGNFEYDGVDGFWETDGLFPYFILLEKNIIGFMLIVERPFLKRDYDFGVNDLFILNKYKGKGLGRQAIQELFRTKKGKCFVIELIENKPAVIFWKSIYNGLNIQFEERQELVDDEQCYIQTFIIE